MSNLLEIIPSPEYQFNDISNYNLEEKYFGNEFRHGGMHDIMESLTPQFPFDNSQNTEKEDNDNDKALYLLKSEESLGDNFNLINFKTPGNFEDSKKVLEKNLTFTGNVNTYQTSKPFLSKKTKKPKEITFKISETIQNFTTKKNNCGRKSKNSEVKGSHNKFSEDNIMRKIKSKFLDYAHLRINDAFKNKNYQFIKLFPDLNENLKKEYNVELMNRTFKDLYENSPLSSRFRKQKKENSDLNKKIIEEIYNDIEQKESDVISLLNLTYLDLLKEFRTIYLGEFLNNIRNEETKNIKNESEEIKENINQYVEKVKVLCLGYENWFYNKNGRTSKKRK